MRRIAAVTSFLFVALAVAIDVASVGEVAANPSQFDKRHLTLTGRVAKYKGKVSRAGKPYFTFDLVDGKAKIAVYGRNVYEPAPRDGDRVEASGFFAVARESAGVVYRNELDATSNGIDRNGIKILK